MYVNNNQTPKQLTYFHLALQNVYVKMFLMCIFLKYILKIRN